MDPRAALINLLYHLVDRGQLFRAHDAQRRGTSFRNGGQISTIKGFVKRRLNCEIFVIGVELTD